MSQPTRPMVLSDANAGEAHGYLRRADDALADDRAAYAEPALRAQALAAMAQAEATLALQLAVRELIDALAPAEADPLDLVRERMARDRVIATRLGPGVRG